MRQATGSNTPQSGNKVSIQLSLDGHSFSVPALSELPAGDAVTAINREALRQVEEKLGDRARFTTPLLHTPANTAKTMWMSRRAGLLYIKVYDGGELQLAEAIPAATDTDAAYFFERLDGCFPLKEYELRIAGDNPKAARKLLGKRFRQTTCE